jgi:superfamily I DNA/RNA helicase/mRNA-degrading endonuclease YafQ of YafQ-DinJ toxin-antitoxin module
MFSEVLMSKHFEKTLGALLAPKRQQVLQKVEMLLANPAHPSLQTHRLWRLGGQIWDCYVDRGHCAMRLLYEIQEQKLILWRLGGHDVVDRAHCLGFDRYAQLLNWRRLSWQEPVALAASDGPQPVQAPEIWPQASVVSPQGEEQAPERNYFAYFREVHLRLLGVPQDQVQAVQEAETLDAVFDLPALPERTYACLAQIATSQEMKTVLLDPSQLLYRTRLDRLEGYFEGRIRKLMLNLAEDQQQYVNLRHVPLLLLKGTAGCGKTTLGVYRAIHLAEEGRRVLVVTYNRRLALTMKTLIEELIGPLPANLEVRTAASVMGSLLHTTLCIPPGKPDELPRRFLREALARVRARESAQVLQRDESFFVDEIRGVIKGLDLVSVQAYKAIRRYGRKTALGPAQREAVWHVYEDYQQRMQAAGIHEYADAAPLVLAQAKSGQVGRHYDDIIVDEAQDLKPVDLRVLQLLVVPEGTLLVLGDAAQTLYSRGFSWVQAGISVRGRTSILRVNHRNTCQIAQAAAQLIQYNRLMRSTDEYVDPQWTRRAGPRPKLLSSPTTHEQIDLVYRQILELLDTQTCRPSDIAVLCCSNRACEQYKSILAGYGLRAVLHTDQEFDILEEQIKVMTIYAAKGLEFPVVFLMGLTEGNLPRPPRLAGQDEEEAQLEIEHERMLCYVGMTRAAEMLYLVTVQGHESRFLSELAGNLACGQGAPGEEILAALMR